MKTKIIPFDLETAKKIQAGEIKGRIMDSTYVPVSIIDFELEGKYPLVVRSCAHTYSYSAKGVHRYSKIHLILEVLLEDAPKHEFKPFDKVLVRDEKCHKWYPTIIGYVSPINGRYCDICRNLILSDILPYEGNEHLVGKTDNPE